MTESGDGFQIRHSRFFCIFLPSLISSYLFDIVCFIVC